MTQVKTPFVDNLPKKYEDRLDLLDNKVNELRQRERTLSADLMRLRTRVSELHLRMDSVPRKRLKTDPRVREWRSEIDRLYELADKVKQLLNSVIGSRILIEREQQQIKEQIEVVYSMRERTAWLERKHRKIPVIP